MAKEYFFIYERDGELVNFAATKNSYWTLKFPIGKDSELCTIYPVDALKANLKTLLKKGIARKTVAGTTKAIAVPEPYLLGLMLHSRNLSPDTSTSSSE